MHPEILRLMNEQRGREMRARAHQARLVKMIRSARRGHDLADETDNFVLPPVPDYVDGTFRTEGVLPVDGQAAGRTGHAPAAKHAA
jgi:hypothetical protein